MRRPIIAVAAAACLTTAACTTDTDPGETPPPTDVTTTTTTTDAPAETADATNPAEESETPKGPPPESDTADGGATGRDVDLADQTFGISPQQAIDTAVQEAGDGIVHALELDWSDDHGAWVYEVDVLVGSVDHDLDIAADTGEILEHDQDNTDDREQAIDPASPMTWETARDEALAAVQGRITSWKLEWDDDHASYEFDIEDATGDETEVEINVDTGDVRVDD